MMKYANLSLFIGTFVGIADTFYLVNEHYSGSVSCSGPQDQILGVPIDCGYVTQSQYSEFLGIPLAFFGLLYYITLFLILYFEKSINQKIKNYEQSYLRDSFDLFLIVNITGLIFSMYLVYLQIVTLDAICLYCMLSVLTTTLMLIIVSTKIIVQQRG